MDDNKETTFNEAVLKMQRIHILQQEINLLRINLLAWNLEYSKYNYDVVISDLISLCYEVRPLMKIEERNEFSLLKELVDDLISYKPIFKKINTSNFSGKNNNESIDTNNWNMLRGVIFKFEDFARDQVDIHGLSAPKKKDASRAAVDL